MKSPDGSEKFINFDKINQLQILDKKSDSDTLENGTNLKNTPNNSGYDIPKLIILMSNVCS